MSTPVNIKDVARLAEVHPATVSRTLNPETRAMVKEETAARVVAAAEQLGYRANPLARGLRTSRSYTIGVLIPDLTNPLFPPIVRGIDDRLARDGYTSLIMSTDGDLSREAAGVASMLARRVDGLIAATAQLDDDPFLEVITRGLPLVLVNRALEDGSVAAVTVDDANGSRLAVEHILDLGHERIGYIGGPQNFSTGHRRYLGFLAAMKAAGIKQPSHRVSFARAFTESEGARSSSELIDRDPTLTALIAVNDRLAIGCYDALADRGLVCPNDVSIIGFNDMPMVDRLNPPLTTVRVPQREIGFASADLVLAQIGQESNAPRQLMLDPLLVIRSSTASPREQS